MKLTSLLQLAFVDKFDKFQQAGEVFGCVDLVVYIIILKYCWHVDLLCKIVQRPEARYIYSTNACSMAQKSLCLAR